MNAPVNELHEVVVAVLVEVGREQREASRARPPGVPGRAAEPKWPTNFVLKCVRQRGHMVTKDRLREVLGELEEAGRVRMFTGVRGALLWSLPPRWNGWSG